MLCNIQTTLGTSIITNTLSKPCAKKHRISTTHAYLQHPGKLPVIVEMRQLTAQLSNCRLNYCLRVLISLISDNLMDVSLWKYPYPDKRGLKNIYCCKHTFFKCQQYKNHHYLKTIIQSASLLTISSHVWTQRAMNFSKPEQRM